MRSLAIVIVLLLLTVGAGRAAQRKKRQAPSQQTQSDHAGIQIGGHWYGRLAWLIAWLLGCATMAQTAIAIFGPFWPTYPVVQAPEASDGGSFFAPFTITNASALFSVENARITCGVAMFMTRAHSVDWIEGFLSDFAFQTMTVSIPRGNVPIHVGCDPRHLIFVNPDGSTSVRNAFEAVKPSLTGSPFKVCLWVGIDYYVPILGFQEVNSPIFQWPASMGGDQWLTGQTFEPMPPRPNYDQQVFYATQCNPTGATPPYIWVRPNGDACLVNGKRSDNCPVKVTRVYDQGGGHNDLVVPDTKDK